MDPPARARGAGPGARSGWRAGLGCRTAVAAALLAEALAALGDPAGAALFERAEALSRGYAVRDRVLAFVAQSDRLRFAQATGGNRDRALAMAAEISDPWSRFETRAGLL